MESIHYEMDYVITHCAPNSIVDILGNGGYVHDHLTDFLEEVKERAKFHYWLFGHYHDNKIIDNRFVLLWEQMVQVGVTGQRETQEEPPVLLFGLFLNKAGSAGKEKP